MKTPLKYRLMIVILYLPVAIIVSGVFGMLHDQISYSLSPEYFTQFKFLQFRLLDSNIPERIRAAQVGWLATWWMGIPLGIVSGIFALTHPQAKTMIRSMGYGLVVMLSSTIMIALIGLAYGIYQTQQLDPQQYAHWFIPRNLQHLREFICVGYMHNSAYLGGAISLIILWFFHLYFKKIHLNNLNSPPKKPL